MNNYFVFFVLATVILIKSSSGQKNVYNNKGKIPSKNIFFKLILSIKNKHRILHKFQFII